jgi:hypothetical protein
VSSAASHTLPDLLFAQARSRPAAGALGHKLRGLWRGQSFAELADSVLCAAAALGTRGFEAGDVLLLSGHPAPEGAVVALAAQTLGGAALALEEGASQAVAAELPAVRFAFAGDEKSFRKDREALGARAAFELVIHTRSSAVLDTAGATSTSYETWLEAHGQQAPIEPRAGESTPALIVLGPAGASFRTHAELLGDGRTQLSGQALGPAEEALDLRSSWTRHLEDTLAPWLESGFCLNHVEQAATAHQDRRELGPTLLLGRADDYARLHARVLEKSFPPASIPGILVGLALADDGPLAGVLGQWLVRGPLRDVLGLTRVRRALVHGPLPARPVMEFFARLGTPLSSAQAGPLPDERPAPRHGVTGLFESEPELSGPPGGSP